jgi:hypothetical protein
MPAIAVRGKGEEGQHLRVEMPAGTVERGGRTLCVGEKRRKDSLCWPYNRSLQSPYGKAKDGTYLPIHYFKKYHDYTREATTYIHSHN